MAAAVSALWPVEHLPNILPNILKNQTPHPVGEVCNGASIVLLVWSWRQIYFWGDCANSMPRATDLLSQNRLEWFQFWFISSLSFSLGRCWFLATTEGKWNIIQWIPDIWITVIVTKTSPVWYITKVKLQNSNDTTRPLGPGASRQVSLILCNFTFVINQTEDVFVTIAVIQLSDSHWAMFYLPSVWLAAFAPLRSLPSPIKLTARNSSPPWWTNSSWDLIRDSSQLPEKSPVQPSMIKRDNRNF